MKRTRLTWGGLLGLTSLLVGCAVAPTRYYSLATPAAEQPMGGAPVAMHGDDVRVVVTSMPPDTDRPQLVVRDPGGQAAVQVLNESLWAAPLDEQIRDVLAAEVSQQLGMPGAQLLPQDATRPVYRVDVRIDRFDMVWERFVAVDAGWTTRAPDGQMPRLCQASVRVPVVGDVAALVDAQRHALSLLSGLIAQSVMPSRGVQIAAPEADAVSESGCT